MINRPGLRTPFALFLTLILVATQAELATAQIGGFGRALGRAAAGAANKLNLDGVLNGEPPITTSLPDAKFAVDSLDNFRPDNLSNYQGIKGRIDRFAVESLSNTALRSLLDLQRTPGGGFVLQPGFYEMHTQSYCLKAGTHGPGGGDGYLYAPTEGPAADQITTIVRNSVSHPEIPQRDVQTLLWAIIARTKVEDMDPKHKATAARLLTPQQLAFLNRTALDLIPGPALEAALDRVPPLVKQVLQAEAQLRQMLVTPGTPFEQLERVAVLAGMAPLGEGSRAVPSGRWNKHPDGYYVRYVPRGYSYTVTQIWVPEGSPGIGKEYDPATHIAVPGNTARQRLIQSGRAQQQS